MAEKKKPPSAIALAVSVAHASQLPVLSLLQVETSADPKKAGLGNVMGLRWATTVDHMEEILKADPEQGHALMVTFPALLDTVFPPPKLPNTSIWLQKLEQLALQSDQT